MMEEIDGRGLFISLGDSRAIVEADNLSLFAD
jgi:hypothetical protein